MPRPWKVFVHGSSLFMAAVQASLAGVLELDVERVDGGGEKSFEWVKAEAPDCIVFEIGVMPEQIVFTLLTEMPGVQLIGLDPHTHRLLVLSAQEEVGPDTDDLVRTIRDRGIAARWATGSNDAAR